MPVGDLRGQCTNNRSLQHFSQHLTAVIRISSLVNGVVLTLLIAAAVINWSIYPRLRAGTLILALGHSQRRLSGVSVRNACSIRDISHFIPSQDTVRCGA